MKNIEIKEDDLNRSLEVLTDFKNCMKGLVDDGALKGKDLKNASELINSLNVSIDSMMFTISFFNKKIYDEKIENNKARSTNNKSRIKYIIGLLLIFIPESILLKFIFCNKFDINNLIVYAICCICMVSGFLIIEKR